MKHPHDCPCARCELRPIKRTGPDVADALGWRVSAARGTWRKDEPLAPRRTRESNPSATGVSSLAVDESEAVPFFDGLTAGERADDLLALAARVRERYCCA